MVFKNLCVLVLWTKVASLLEGLNISSNQLVASTCSSADLVTLLAISYLLIGRNLPNEPRTFPQRPSHKLQLAGWPGVIRALQHHYWSILNLFSLKLLSGSLILLPLTSELRIIWQIFWRRVFGSVLNNIVPSNIFPTSLLPTIFHQNHQTAFSCCEYQLVKQTHLQWLFPVEINAS